MRYCYCFPVLAARLMQIMSELRHELGASFELEISETHFAGQCQYLTQCSFVISSVPYHSPKGNSTGNHHKNEEPRPHCIMSLWKEIQITTSMWNNRECGRNVIVSFYAHVCIFQLPMHGNVQVYARCICITIKGLNILWNDFKRQL